MPAAADMSKRPKAGTSKAAAADRRRLFVLAYIANGHNGTQAAIAAGFSEKTARSQGQRLLTDVDVQNLLAGHSRDVAAIVGLDTERTLREVARLAYNDPRQFFAADGTLKPIEEWTEDMGAAVASLEVDELFAGTGEDRKAVGHTKKLKFWDKNAALEKAMKHHGLYERDNGRQGQSYSLQVVVVGGKGEEPMPAGSASTARQAWPGIELVTKEPANRTPRITD
jgi:phage terminase small subunit